ncbi:POK11 protein, partial [Heliornis fulica]|nr:POK11 protein [Heliornis fulica]
VQKLMGSLNWVWPYLGLTNSQLQPLFDLLRHANNPYESRTLTAEAIQTVKQVEQALQTKFVSRIDLSQVIQLAILCDHTTPFGTLVQWNPQWSNPLHII